MSTQYDRFVLPDVPVIKNPGNPDIFAEALRIALCYEDEGVFDRVALLRAYRLRAGDPDQVYAAISSVTGRGWLVGFDDAAYYWERYGVMNPQTAFAVAGPQAYLTRHETLSSAIRCLDHEPELLWHRDCAYQVDPQLAAGFVSAACIVGAADLRRYVIDYLAARRRPLVVLLHSPQAPIVEMTLLTGYEAGGEVILGRSLYQAYGMDNSGDFGYFRLANWEPSIVAVFGLDAERPAPPERSFCALTIQNGLRYSRSHSEGTRHYGLDAYDAWEAALLDDASIDGVPDEIVARRLLMHSATAGTFACQKAFTVLPECDAPTMGVVTALARRALAGPLLIHGLMWDVWQIAGGYWRGIQPGTGSHRLEWTNAAEVERFRMRAVRESAAAVIRRARRVDEQSLQDLAEAWGEWVRCRGRGNSHPCPCWDRPCTRVEPTVAA